ncbi:hypothetical protein BDC45DRAFT_578419 [Circinella umbellata]|nr:hypothetical protein BDC45DRAFT_578419 [Circinella umbellata]
MTRSTSLTAPASTYKPNKSRIRVRFNRPPPPPRRISIPKCVFSYGWVQTGLGSVIKKIQRCIISKKEIAPRRRLQPSHMSFSRVGSTLNAASPLSSPPLFPVGSDSSLSSLSSLSTLSLGSSSPPHSPTLSLASVFSGSSGSNASVADDVGSYVGVNGVDGVGREQEEEDEEEEEEYVGEPEREEVDEEEDDDDEEEEGGDPMEIDWRFGDGLFCNSRFYNLEKQKSRFNSLSLFLSFKIPYFFHIPIFIQEVEATPSRVSPFFIGVTRSGVTGRLIPLGRAEEDGISADGLVERRQGSVCSYYGW